MNENIPDFSQVPAWVFDLPPANASFNLLSTLFLVIGWVLIKKGNKKGHAISMIIALITSAIFLTFYLIYHASLQKYAGGASIRFTHEGWIRPIYFFILITHIILAIVNLPMILTTVFFAARRKFDTHRKWARWTWPIWLYVSVTGVIVYVLLYHLYPSAYLQNLPSG